MLLWRSALLCRALERAIPQSPLPLAWQKRGWDIGFHHEGRVCGEALGPSSELYLAGQGR